MVDRIRHALCTKCKQLMVKYEAQANVTYNLFVVKKCNTVH